MTAISTIDWYVIGAYLFGLILMAAFLSRGQFNREDYYVGGRKMGKWPIAISVMATQCSTNSILGAPAFVAFAAGGGLIWLQYELAVPLAMIALIWIFIPLFRKLKLITVYQYLEQRFDLKTRLLLSGSFMFVRAFATAVTVYSISLVVELITGLSFFQSIIVLGVFTVVYDVLGGIKGVIYSDVLQMLILVIVLIILSFVFLNELGGFNELLDQFDADRKTAVDFSHHGLGDGHTFAFWPMLFGGFILYISYYGFDQSQVQRELSAKNLDESNGSLFINGLLRFPLVALYCFVGVGISVYASHHPEFVQSLPLNNESPNYNLSVPAFMVNHLPIGIVGLGLVALFAAAMSSLDSVLNSLSATTMEDYVRRFSPREMTPVEELWISRLLTVFWGVITVVASFYVGDIAPTVLEAINKIGSLINGPIAGVFALGVLTRRASGSGACFGFCAGFILNTLFWLYIPQVSWLWWNVIGLVTCIICGYTYKLNQDVSLDLVWSPDQATKLSHWRSPSLILILWFATLLGILTIL